MGLSMTPSIIVDNILLISGIIFYNNGIKLHLPFEIIDKIT